jgi:hypothetical protein
MKIRPFHLTTLLQHIHGTDEVSMSCSPSQVKFESYYTNPLDGTCIRRQSPSLNVLSHLYIIVKSHVHTETTVDTSEFIAYVFNQLELDVVQLIFGLKEIKVITDDAFSNTIS